MSKTASPPVAGVDELRQTIRLGAQSAVVEWLAPYKQEYRLPHDRLCDLVADAILRALASPVGGDGPSLRDTHRDPAPPVVGWQDISTAPRDGTKFDAWDRDGRITDVYWSDIQDAFCTDGLYGPEEPSPLAAYPSPTHWMPLPPPPAASVSPGMETPQASECTKTKHGEGDQ